MPMGFISAVDIISAIEFDKAGDYLATGNRCDWVAHFEKTYTKDVCNLCLDCLFFLILGLFNLFRLIFSQHIDNVGWWIHMGFGKDKPFY